MGLLTRAVQKIFGSTGGTGEFGQIGSKAAGAAATTKDLETMQSLSEYLLGLNAIVSDQGTSVLPYLEDMNSLFFLTTSQLAYLFQAGVPEWDDATEYYEGVSMVLSGGNIFVDTYGTVGTPNLNYEPSANLDKWRSVVTDGFYIDAGSANVFSLTSITGTISPAYFDGMKATFKAAATNTGASNININGLGVKDIRNKGGSVLRAGQIVSGDYVTAVYDPSGAGIFIITSINGDYLSNLFMRSGVGLDFRSDTKGIFKGIAAVTYRMASTVTGDADPIAVWEPSDDTTPEYFLGPSSTSLIDQSATSGLFVFQQTGYFYINFNGRTSSAGANRINYVNMSVDVNGAGYNQISQTGATNSNGSYPEPLGMHALVKITTLPSTLKFSFNAEDAGGFLIGDTSNNVTHFTVIKLADI